MSVPVPTNIATRNNSHFLDSHPEVYLPSPHHKCPSQIPPSHRQTRWAQKQVIITPISIGFFTPVTDLVSAIYRGYLFHPIYNDRLGAHLEISDKPPCFVLPKTGSPTRRKTPRFRSTLRKSWMSTATKNRFRRGAVVFICSADPMVCWGPFGDGE